MELKSDSSYTPTAEETNYHVGYNSDVIRNIINVVSSMQ